MRQFKDMHTLSDNSNVIPEYVPPSKKERLKDAQGKELRHMGEKSASCNAVIAARYTKPGATVLDLFAGTASLGCTIIAMGNDRKYVGVDNDNEVIGPAQERLGRAWMVRQRNLDQDGANLSRILAFQTAASEQSAFMLPANNVPSGLKCGRPLAAGPHGNLDFVAPATETMFVIKETNLAANGAPMGEGIFLKVDAAPIEAGTDITSIYFFGAFMDSKSLEAKFPDGVPGYPGVFHLCAPFENYNLVLDERCPGAKINDPKGIEYRDTIL